jgi:2,4-dienoyl-CoA reductase-like NADH-dependent reductase (Old Yellow Enzyme family)
MSKLFTPKKLGNIEIKNRFVHSATYECLARENGEVTDEIISRYRNLGRGEVGLIIPGHLYVHPLGKALQNQTGIHDDDLIPGLKKLVEAVHQESGKIAFQLSHSGRQSKKAVIGQTPMGPSSVVRDPTGFFKPRAMSNDEIQEVILAFGQAARRAVEAGADGIQLHAAHGYLINQFLSPFFNRREDDWGGSDENRFRFMKEVFLEIKKVLPEGMPLLVKLNTHDHTPQKGITLPLAAKYAGWMAELGIDGLEVSCGSTVFSPMNLCRGAVPVKEILQPFPWWQRLMGRLALNKWVGKYDLEEGYNLEAAKMIRPVLGEIPLFLVGGMRTKAKMEEVLDNNHADFISMSRPFIREPFVVKKFKEGRADAVACVSCNRCSAAIVMNEMPIRCYDNGLPD